MNGLSKVLSGVSDFDIVGRARRWALVSGIVLGVGVIGLLGRGLNLGLEFTGGTSMQVPIAPGTTVTVPEVEQALSDFDLGDAKVQVTGRGRGATTPDGRSDEILVRAKHIDSDETLNGVQRALARVAGQSSIDIISIQDVGPTWGRQVSAKALRGLIVFLVLVTIYISFRFEPKMALAAIAALFHDLLATAGVYALVGFEVTPATVIALLTLLGYSLYDTVVVFDKVDENVIAQGAGGKVPYSDLVNVSVNQVLMRSINTSLSTLLPIGGLLFVGVLLFGAVTLKDLALAMFVGTIVGTYSSIFVASPLLAWLKEREPRYKAIRARATRTTGKPGADDRVPEHIGATSGAPAATPAPSKPKPTATSPQTPRPRKRKRGKRR